MTILLLYAYCVGIVSFRRIKARLLRNLAVRVLTGKQQPDHSRIK
jgi:transposase